MQRQLIRQNRMVVSNSYMALVVSATHNAEDNCCRCHHRRCHCHPSRDNDGLFAGIDPVLLSVSLVNILGLIYDQQYVIRESTLLENTVRFKVFFHMPNDLRCNQVTLD